MLRAVKNPTIYNRDEAKENGQPTKYIILSRASDVQIGMLEALAAKVHWDETDGYLRLADKKRGWNFPASFF